MVKYKVVIFQRFFTLKKFIAILISLILIISCGCFPLESQMEKDNLYVYFIDVGQADCALISLNGKNMLIDGGNADDGPSIISFISRLGISTIDTVVATHPHEDHIGGLSTIIDAFNVNTVYSPVDFYNSVYFRELEDAANRQCGITLCEKGFSWKLDSADVSVLWASDDEENTNNTSIVLKLIYKNVSFLFTGDIESDGEANILKDTPDLDANVLKVAHHGSSTSTSYYFLRSAMPQLAVISCGKDNSYGHPHKETVEKLNQADVKSVRTDEEGTVTVVSDGTQFYFYTENSNSVEYFDYLNPTPVAVSHYIGNKKSKKFHLPSCSGLPNEKNSIKLFSREQALAEGYSPCGTCNP